MIRPFCEDKHFTAAVHFRFGCKTLKNHFDNTLHFSPISKQEQWRLVVMNNLWKCQCHATDNKAYRALQTSYVNCKHKAEFLWFCWWECLSSYYYVTETRSPNEANHLKRVRLKSQRSGTSSNKQKYKKIASQWNISYCRKHVTFWIEGTFILASSVQEVPVLFKWNDLQSLGKALVDF